MHIPSFLKIFLTGFTMGAADLVPGVSGGTIAFIFGVYEKLITSIKTVTNEVPALILKGQVKKAWGKIPFTFLIPIGIGILSAIVLLSKLIHYLLHSHPVMIWSFFFGLVLASVVVVSKRVKKWSTQTMVAVGLGAIVSYAIVGAVPVETAATPAMFFVAGMIAICAMILPGISGSFLLVIMGKYSQVLEAVTQRDIITLGIVMAGAVVGLAVFSRILNHLFKNHHDVMVATLTGVMLGSLRKVWPWKEILTTRINSKGIEVPVTEMNIFPPALDLNLGLAIFFAVVGVILILKLSDLNSKPN